MVGPFGTQELLGNRQRASRQGFGLAVLAFDAQHRCQVDCVQDGQRTAHPQRFFIDCQGLPQRRLRFGVLPGQSVQRTLVDETHTDVGTLGSERLLVDGQRVLQHTVGFPVSARIQQYLTQGIQQRSAERRLEAGDLVADGLSMAQHRLSPGVVRRFGLRHTQRGEHQTGTDALPPVGLLTHGNRLAKQRNLFAVAACGIVQLRQKEIVRQ